MTYGPKPRPEAERFWSKVDKNGPVHPRLGTACWLWTGTGTGTGTPFRGNFRVGSMTDGTRRKVIASRWALESVVGPIPEGLFACHHCDNPRCVNPAHLYAGTQLDNVRDMVERGRARRVSQPGTSNPNYRHGLCVGSRTNTPAYSRYLRDRKSRAA